MTHWGYTLSSEEFPPDQLVRQAVAAEDAGFDFVTVSDHFHPWIRRQGHSPFVWTTLGAVAVSTDRIRVGTGVTCPTMRLHPAVVAQAAATTAGLFDAGGATGRFFLGVGTGEALNEHVTGVRWPPADVRREMLEEAVGVIRHLWTGETVDHRGAHYTVENARLFTVPHEPPPIIWAASGVHSATSAATCADGLWATSPDPDVVTAYRDAGGSGPMIGQVTVCYDTDAERARRTAHDVWPNACNPGQLSQDLPTWVHFEDVATLISVDDVADEVPCGPDLGAIERTVTEYVDAGFDQIHFHQIGPRQDAFIEIWPDLRARLA